MIPRGFLFGIITPGLTYLFDVLRTREFPCLKYVARVEGFWGVTLVGLEESCRL